MVSDLLLKTWFAKTTSFLLFGRTQCVKTTGNTNKFETSLLQNIVFFNGWEARGVTKPGKSLSLEKVHFSKHIVVLFFGPPKGAQTYGDNNSLKSANQWNHLFWHLKSTPGLEWSPLSPRGHHGATAEPPRRYRAIAWPNLSQARPGLVCCASARIDPNDIKN